MKIRELLTDESKWCQGHYGQDANFEVCSAHSPNAMTWCLVGAISRCYGNPDLFIDELTEAEIVEKVRLALDHDGRCDIEDWNDAPNRTFAEVKALVERLDI